MTEKQNNEWYSNKEIFEQLQSFKDNFVDLSKDLTAEMYDMRQEITETKMLIKEYNGLRKEINDTKVLVQQNQKETATAVKKELDDSKKKIEELEKQLTEITTSVKTLKWVGGGLVTVITLILGVLEYIYKV